MSDPFDLPGGPAFPISIPGCGDNGCPGMSLRDWFAGLVVASMITKLSEDPRASWSDQRAAGRCYEIADAMLRAREVQSLADEPETKDSNTDGTEGMSGYSTRVFWSAEDGGYIAIVPELPGCSAFGETQEKTLEELQGAIAAWLEARASITEEPE